MGLNPNNIENLLLHILIYSYLLPVLVVLFLFRTVSSRLSAFLIAFILYFLIYFTLNFYFSEIKKALGRNLYYLTYTLCEFLFFAACLWYYVNSSKIRKAIVVLTLSFALFISLFFLTTKIKRVDSIPIGIETILIIGLIAIYFHRLFYSAEKTSVTSQSSFWIVTGILIYLGGTFFFNILANYISHDIYTDYWYLTYFGDIIKNIFASIGVYIYLNTNQEASKKKKNSIPYLDMI